MKLKPLFFLVLSWRIGLFLIASVATNFISYQPSFPYSKTLLLARGLPQWLVSWANFDGVHYLTIIEKGYIGTGLIPAFFPLFPLSIKVANLLAVDTVVFGLLVSNLAMMLTILVFHSYLKQYFSVKIANWSVAGLLLFPTSFFFGAFYSESLFVLLVISSLWSAQQKKWWLASMLAALASATRLVGIFLVPALLLELLQQNTSQAIVISQLKKPLFYKKFIVRHFKQMLIILLGSIGLLSYMLYLSINFNDPLYFFHVQSEFGGGRQESLVLLPQVVWRYLKIFITYRPFDLKYYAFIQEFLLTGLAYGAIFLARNKVRWSWTLFSLLAISLPTLTGTFSSMPRYILVALPIFVLFGSYLSTQKIAWKLLLALSTLLLVCNTILFIQGYWVA